MGPNTPILSCRGHYHHIHILYSFHDTSISHACRFSFHVLPSFLEWVKGILLHSASDPTWVHPWCLLCVLTLQVLIQGPNNKPNQEFRMALKKLQSDRWVALSLGHNDRSPSKIDFRTLRRLCLHPWSDLYKSIWFHNWISQLRSQWGHASFNWMQLIFSSKRWRSKLR